MGGWQSFIREKVSPDKLQKEYDDIKQYFTKKLGQPKELDGRRLKWKVKDQEINVFKHEGDSDIIVRGEGFVIKEK